jgi:hypothetical protein
VRKEVNHIRFTFAVLPLPPRTDNPTVETHSAAYPSCVHRHAITRSRHFDTVFYLPPPLSAKTSQPRPFDTVLMSSASLACKSEPEVDIYTFLTPPPSSHTKASRMWHFDAFAPTPPPSYAGVGPLCRFDAVHASSTSLACKCDPEEGIRLFASLPPPSYARSRRRWTSSPSTSLEQAGGGIPTLFSLLHLSRV